MDKEISAKDDHKQAASGLPLPATAQDCGMEEAFGLNLLQGPAPDLRGISQPVDTRPARTDFVRS